MDTILKNDIQKELAKKAKMLKERFQPTNKQTPDNTQPVGWQKAQQVEIPKIPGVN